MKICNYCGKENKDSDPICEFCATPFIEEDIDISEYEESKEHKDFEEFKKECSDDTDKVALLNKRYRILETIKSGGMGCIYKAEDTRLNVIVAVKKMLQYYHNEEQKEYAEKRFIQEAKILSKLHHGGLPKVSDYFVEDDPKEGRSAQYIVMTYIEGKDLETMMKEDWKGIPPLNISIDYFRQILEILSYLHSQDPPIVYRDLKPSNIMIHNEYITTPSGHWVLHGKVFLVDFGIAKTFEPEKVGTMVGIFGFAAPEQYRGFSEPRSDIYSLGVVMHYLLTGIKPTDGNRPPFMFKPITTINPDIPKYLDNIIMSMLEINTANRPKSAEEILRFLARHLEGSGKIGIISPKHAPIVKKSAPSPEPKESLDKKYNVAAEGKTSKSSFEMTALRDRTVPPKPCKTLDVSEGKAKKQSLDSEFEDTSPDIILYEKTQNLIYFVLFAFITVGIILFLFVPDVSQKMKELIYGPPKEDNSLPLHRAVASEDLKSIEKALAGKADVNQPDRNGLTPLYKAVSRRNKEIVRVLLEKGANPNLSDSSEGKPLNLAAKNGD